MEGRGWDEGGGGGGGWGGGRGVGVGCCFAHIGAG